MASIERLEGYLAQDPGNVDLALALFDACVEQGRIAAAEQFYAQRADADAASWMFRGSRLDLLAGRYAAAEGKLRALAEQQPAAPVLHDLAFAQLCQRKLAEASATVALSRERHASTVELEVLAARIALLDGNFEAASASLSAALAIAPGDPVALGLAALTAADAGDPIKARQLANAAVQADPEQHEALLTLGTLALHQRDAAVAEASFALALKRLPMSGRALSGLGQAHMLAGQAALARPALERAVEAMPDHIGTWHALGWLQLLQGRPDLAQGSYQRAFDLDRNFSESHGGLAVVALLTGRAQDGEGAMRRALKLDPSSISGRYAHTLWLSDQGKQDESDAQFSALLAEGALSGVPEVQGAPSLIAARLRRQLSGAPQ